MALPIQHPSSSLLPFSIPILPWVKLDVSTKVNTWKEKWKTLNSFFLCPELLLYPPLQQTLAIKIDLRPRLHRQGAGRRRVRQRGAGGVGSAIYLWTNQEDGRAPCSAHSGRIIVPAQHREGFGRGCAGARAAIAGRPLDAGAVSGQLKCSTDPNAL